MSSSNVMANPPPVGAGAGVFVLGTDTGVGKTKVSAGLVHGLAARQLRVAGLKPVVSGAVGWREAPEAQPGVWEDVLALEQAGGVLLPFAERTRVALQAPASPHFAAAEQGLTLDFAELVAGVQFTMRRHDFSVVEGVGGVRVPLNAQFDTADLAVALNLPVVLVVGMRLGCINHALLSCEALQARGLTVVSWVANTGVSDDYERVGPTIDTISARLGVPCSAMLPALPPLPSMEWTRREHYLAALRLQAALAAGALQKTMDGLLAN